MTNALSTEGARERGRHPATRVDIEQELDLRTNHEVRAAILALSWAGYSNDELAHVFGRTTSRIVQALRKPRPERQRITTAFVNDEGPAACECGASVSRETVRRAARAGRTIRCHDCAIRGVAEHRARLLDYANDVGHVPSVDDAARVTGLSRGRAGEILQDVFGYDPRIGGQRRFGPRPWPPLAKAASE